MLILNYFILATAALWTYLDMKDGTKQFYLLLGIMICILFSHLTNVKLWTFLGYLGTFSFILFALVRPLKLSLYIEVLAYEKEWNSINPVLILIGIAIGLAIFSTIIKLSINLLTIMWSIFFSLIYFVTFTTEPLGEFLKELTSWKVKSTVITNYFSILLLAAISGLFIEFSNRPRRGEIN